MRDRRVIRIAIEGIDGCGKDLQLELLHGALEMREHHVVRRREPSESSPLGRFIRSQFTEDVDRMLPDSALSVLFAADRIVQWWTETYRFEGISHGIPSGEEVIFLSNRSVASAYAYHGIDNPMHEHLSPPEVWPDLVLVLRVPVEVASSRLRVRADRDRFEQEARLRRVAPAYEELSRVAPNRTSIVYVDATPDEFQVASQVLKEVQAWLGQSSS
jgi:dTMP kinase